MPSSLSRRRLLGMGGALTITAAAGCSGSVPGLGTREPLRRERATCVPRTALDSHRRVAGLPLVYEVNGRPSAFRFDGGFYARLESWADDLVEVLPSPPEQLWTYGSWTDGRSACDSWHNSGRAFDLARLRLAGGSVVSCRYDQWRTLGAVRLDEARRRYWSLAAGLHHRFANVLTYLYDGQHANHIHVDNGRSGNADSAFSPRSRVQVQAVQALCSYLWDRPVEISGQWDAATRTATGQVLNRLGLGASMDSAGNWSSFLVASARRGTD
jgi:hypothetical protein